MHPAESTAPKVNSVESFTESTTEHTDDSDAAATVRMQQRRRMSAAKARASVEAMASVTSQVQQVPTADDSDAAATVRMQQRRRMSAAKARASADLSATAEAPATSDAVTNVTDT